LLGVVAGYLVYSLTHHATHHWRSRGPLARRRKQWHAQHHHSDAPVCFGVTTRFWDRVFGTDGGEEQPELVSGSGKE